MANRIKKIGDNTIEIQASGIISDYSLRVISDIMNASNCKTAIITSLQRNASKQASAMMYNIKKKGVANQMAIYKSPGRQVIQVYADAKASGKGDAATLALMTAKINELGPKTVSNHAADPNVLNVIDIAANSKSVLADRWAFLAAAQNIRDTDGRISKVLDEINVNKVIHIEIPQEEDTSVEKSGSDSTPSAVDEVQTSEKATPWTNDGEYTGQLISGLAEDDPNFIAYTVDADDINSFEYKGVSNHKRTWLALPRDGREDAAGTSQYDPTVDYPIAKGLTIYVPPSMVTVTWKKTVPTKPLITQEEVEANQQAALIRRRRSKYTNNPTIQEYSSNITVTKTKEGRYYPKVLKYITLDPGYTPTFKNNSNITKSIWPRLKVFIWSRVKYLEKQGLGFIDATPMIQSLSINSGFNGAEFSITMAPMVGRLSANISKTEGRIENVWEAQDVIESKSGNVVSLGNINRNTIYNDNHFGSGVISNAYIRSHQYQEKVFQQNDMVFIRFEQLDIDADSSSSMYENIHTTHINENGSRVNSQWYDLIGLVDYVEVASSAQGNDVSLNVVGRDLTKALIEDNTYFNPYSIGHSASIYGGEFGSNGRFNNGAFKDISAMVDRSVKQSMEFLFHRISSIGYIPDDVLELFPNKTEVSVIKKLPKSSSDKRTTEIKPARGFWQIVKFWIDDNIKDLRLIDDSVANPEGSVWDLMKKICQPPFVELFTETLGSEFYVIARKPPFERKVLSKIINEVSEDTSKVNGSINGDAVMQSAYKKYLDCVSKKKIYGRASFSPTIYGINDSAESRRQKLELANKKKIMVSSDEERRYLEKYGAVIVNDEVVKCNEALTNSDSVNFPLIINIGGDDVIRDNFRMTQTAYAWYQLHDRGNFAGANVSLGHVPSVYFDEYAQALGNRKLEAVSNYSDYRFFESSNKEESSNLYAEQASQLLAFLVETNIHLPFTREGSFTINGDRRIKKGTYIYYRPTREIFYVTNVENNISLNHMMDRTTTVTVSRGMIIDYIDGKEEEIWKPDGRTTTTKKVSYFNIVDIKKLTDGVYDTVNGGASTDKFDYKADMLIDTDVFNFFLKRRQFKETYG